MKANIEIQNKINTSLFEPGNLLQLKADPSKIVLVTKRGPVFGDNPERTFRGMYLTGDLDFISNRMIRSGFEQFNGTIILTT